MYIENPKDSIRKLVELISESSKVAGYNISTQKALAFLYTNNENSEKETQGIQIGKEKVKLSLFAGAMILYIENPKDIRKLLELIS